MTGRRVVFLSAYHDYRTSKRASIHHVAAALARQSYDVTFLSTRFSWLSRIKGDSRLPLWNRSNRFEMFEGVRCYLWRTAFHPFASGNPLVNAAMTRLFPWYERLPSRTVDAIFAEADYVVVESSVAAILIGRIRRIAPRAKIIYYATDQLDTVGAHAYVARSLARNGAAVDHVSMRSPRMAPQFGWAGDRLYRAEFGIDPADYAATGPSPYAPGEQAAIAVGSMLFDPAFFRAVAPAFPQVRFHVIGCGMRFDAPDNVIVHDEKPFADTLAYLAHASVGIAPYRWAPGVEYLVDSSLKLAQYEHLGKPAVCPDFAAGGNPTRFGYAVGDADAMRAAFGAALSGGAVPRRDFPTWDAVARDILEPDARPELRVDPADPIRA